MDIIVKNNWERLLTHCWLETKLAWHQWSKLMSYQRTLSMKLCKARRVMNWGYEQWWFTLRFDTGQDLSTLLVLACVFLMKYSFDLIQWYLNSYAFDTSCHISGENQQNRCLTETNKLHSELSDFVSNPWNAFLKCSITDFWLTEEAFLLLIVPISFQGASLVSLQSYSCLSLTLL